MQRPAYLGYRYESDPCWYNIFYLEFPQESNDEVLTFPPGTPCIYVSDSNMTRNFIHSVSINRLTSFTLNSLVPSFQQ
jgi:hypothetical protein